MRAFSAVGGTPRFITSASGCTLHDADGNSYVDLVSSWGPMILGHANAKVVGAIQEAATGKLEWRLTLAPNEKRTLTFSYQVKRPRGWKLYQQEVRP